MKYMGLWVFILFISSNAFCSVNSEGNPLIPKRAFHGGQFTVMITPPAVQMSEEQNHRPFGYRAGKFLGQANAGCHYAYPLNCSNHSEPTDFDTDQRPNGIGMVLLETCSQCFMCGTSVGIVSTVCCLYCGCSAMLGKVVIATVVSGCGALCGGCSMYICSIPESGKAEMCNIVGCNNCALGFETGYVAKKAEITAPPQNEIPAIVTMNDTDDDL